MILHKIIFPKKHSKIKDLQIALDELLEDRVNRGEHLKDEPFLPEDIDFKITTDYDKGDGFTELYERDGWYISPFVYGDYGKYAVITPDNSRIVVKMANLYEGIIILKGLGMDVSVEKLMEKEDIINYIKENSEEDEVNV